jgi:hypothetical protein
MDRGLQHRPERWERRPDRREKSVALITTFEKRPLEPRRVHDAVVCGWAVREINGRRVVQLETYGSRDREFPDKVSQSIQLDADGARQLKRILEYAFPES